MSEIGDLKQSIDILSQKIDQLIVDMGDRRVAETKNATRTNGIERRLGSIETHVPDCEKRFQSLEKSSNFFSGKVIGIGLAFISLLSLASLVVSLWRHG